MGVANADEHNYCTIMSVDKFKENRFIFSTRICLYYACNCKEQETNQIAVLLITVVLLCILINLVFIPWILLYFIYLSILYSYLLFLASFLSSFLLPSSFLLSPFAAFLSLLLPSLISLLSYRFSLSCLLYLHSLGSYPVPLVSCCRFIRSELFLFQLPLRWNHRFWFWGSQSHV